MCWNKPVCTIEKRQVNTLSTQEKSMLVTIIRWFVVHCHYDDVIMSAMASQITGLTIVYSTVYSGVDQRKHQSSVWLAFVRGIHRGLVNSPYEWPVPRKMFPFDDAIMVPPACITHSALRNIEHSGEPSLWSPRRFNTWRPRQNGRHFADDIFKCIFLNENIWTPVKVSLNFVPKGPINNIPSLVQIMAWRRSGDKPLSEPMMVGLTTHICVTRPRWVKLTL